jgi:hypothetical protein
VCCPRARASPSRSRSRPRRPSRPTTTRPDPSRTRRRRSPAPDPHGEPPATIDEAAEEAAAAAEAAAIGGTTSDYAGLEPGEPADEAYRPLAEAGQGEAEGEEQAEAALADNATYRDAGMSDVERQIDDAIEQAGQPHAGETPEPLVSGQLDSAASESGAAEPAEDAVLPPTAAPVTDDTAADTPGGGISGRPFAGLDRPAARSPRRSPSRGPETG